MTDRKTLAAAGVTIVVAQFSISVGAALGKRLIPELGSEGVVALRTGFSAALLIAYARPWRTIIAPKAYLLIVAYGLALAGMNLLIYSALQRLPIGVAVAIEITGPLTIVLVGSRSAQDLFWFAAAVTSLLMLIPWPGSGSHLDALGMVFALGAAVCWALYIIFGRRASGLPGATVVALGLATACVLTVPLGIAVGGRRLLVPGRLLQGVAVAIFSNAIPYVLEMTALKRLTSRAFGLAASSAPAVTALTGYVILGERLSGSQWVAIALMMVAIGGASFSKTGVPPPPPEPLL